MENRYLFKAKRVDNGEWVQGYYYKIWERGYILWGMNNDVPNMVEVDTSTLCQCTGLKDKNGKLIWENDIVREFNSSGDAWNLSQIIFGEYSLNLGWCAIGIKTLHEYNRRLFNVGFGTSEAEKCEVIGNKFDNPDLISQN